MNKEVIIYSEPLTKEEWKNHYGKPLKLPTRYNLIDVFKELKFGRPCEDQEVLDSFIAYLELSGKGRPFSQEVVDMIFNS